MKNSNTFAVGLKGGFAIASHVVLDNGLEGIQIKVNDKTVRIRARDARRLAKALNRYADSVAENNFRFAWRSTGTKKTKKKKEKQLSFDVYDADLN